MSKKKPAQFKRFSDALSKIVRVSKDELAKREVAYRRARRKNSSDPDPSMTESTAAPSAADPDVPK